MKVNQMRELTKEGEWVTFLVKGSGDKELLCFRGSFSH